MVDKEEIRNDLIRLVMYMGFPTEIVTDDIVEVYHILAQEYERDSGKKWQSQGKEFGKLMRRWSKIYIKISPDLK